MVKAINLCYVYFTTLKKQQHLSPTPVENGSWIEGGSQALFLLHLLALLQGASGWVL